MAKCEWCGKTFDVDEARDDFECETGLSYDNLALCLCGDCAIDAIDDEADGVYFETCEECGNRFDLFEEQSKFENGPNDYGSLRDYWDEKILCADCAIEEAENRYEEYRNEHPEDFDDYGYEEDDDDDESLSVEEAAQIWASHGKDEDYMFGYSEDELEDAL